MPCPAPVALRHTTSSTDLGVPQTACSHSAVRDAPRREPNGRGGHGGRGGDTRRPGTGDGASTGVEGGVGHLQDLQLLSTDMAAATGRHAELQAAMNKRARIRARVRGRICCACVPVCLCACVLLV